MIFPVLRVEEVVQIADKTRLDASASFVAGTEETIAIIEIQPEAAADWIDVSETGYLDWAYATEGAKVPTVRLTLSGDTPPTPTEFSGDLLVITSEDDLLFSSDAKLRAHQSDILKFLPEGRASFLDAHRRTQTLILDWLAKEGYLDTAGQRLEKDAITVTEDVESWATYLCLSLIYEDASNAVDDVFAGKAKGYYGKATNARDRAVLSLDLNGDGEADVSEKIQTRGCVVRRR